MKETRLALDELLNLLPDTVVIIDRAGQIAFVNQPVRELLGYDPGELVGQPLDCLIPKPYRRKHRAQVAQFREYGHSVAMSARPLVRGLTRDGAEVPVSVAIANIDLDGQPYSIAVLRDSGELFTEITQITTEAATDSLTGLANRTGFSQAIEAAIEKSGPFGLLFLDLEKFKPFNDSYGHEVGDRVLQIIGRRLRSSIRPGDVAARLGGDEFVLLLTEVGGAEAALRVAHKVLAALREPISGRRRLPRA